MPGFTRASRVFSGVETMRLDSPLAERQMPASIAAVANLWHATEIFLEFMIRILSNAHRHVTANPVAGVSIRCVPSAMSSATFPEMSGSCVPSFFSTPHLIDERRRILGRVGHLQMGAVRLRQSVETYVPSVHVSRTSYQCATSSPGSGAVGRRRTSGITVAKLLCQPLDFHTPLFSGHIYPDFPNIVICRYPMSPHSPFPCNSPYPQSRLFCNRAEGAFHLYVDVTVSINFSAP